ncbi:MAG TPA: serine/threonine-protein kinase [Gemmatimonadales bacterium]
MSTLAAEPVSGIAELDVETRRRTIRRALGIGLWVWPSFTLLDAWMCFVAYPGAPFGLFLVYRLLVEFALWVAYQASRNPDRPLRHIVWGQNLSYSLAALGVALMAVPLGGIRSPYMHGLSVVALVRATTVPEPWRRALPAYAAIALAFPLVMGTGAVLSPGARTDWLTAEALTVFVSNYVFVVSSALIGLVTGHVMWAAQEQVFRARRLGRYRLQAPLGKGAMGEVWLAWDLSLRRNVALKLLRQGGNVSSGSVKRFEREALAASQLRGPHTVQIYDFGASDDGIYYIAMEYLTGTDLRTLVAGAGPLPPARAASFVMQACLSLEEAHAAGIIHRDIKPHNLFVTRVGENPDFIKLLDFGIVRFRPPGGGGDQHLTQTGFLAGTPAYMAPELWRGAPADERSDVYALGVTLYYLLTGLTPFDASSTREMMVAHLEWTPRRPSESGASPVPDRLEEVVLRCLAKRPEDRYPSVRALHRALEVACDPAEWTVEDARAFWERSWPAAGSSAPDG